MTTTLILKLTALTYLGLIAAGLLMPGAVVLREHLRELPKFIRQLFWVYYAFIGLSLTCFGLGTFFLADQLASGTPLARAGDRHRPASCSPSGGAIRGGVVAHRLQVVTLQHVEDLQYVHDAGRGRGRLGRFR